MIATPSISPARYLYYFELSKKLDLTVISETPILSDLQKATGFNIKENIKIFNGAGFKLFKYMAFSPSNIIKVLRWRKRKILIIEQYATPTAIFLILVLRIFRHKYIISVDGGIVNTDESKFKFLLKSFLLQSADKYLSTGINADNYLVHYGVNLINIYRYPLASMSVKHKTIITIPNSFMKFNNGHPIILFVGQFIHRKGIDILANIIANIDTPVNFILIGGTIEQIEMDDETESIIKSKLDTIRIIKFASKIDLAYYYQYSDVVIITTREDIWNYTLMESYFFETLCVSSNKACAALDYAVFKDSLLVSSEKYIDYINSIKEAIAINKEIINGKSINPFVDYIDTFTSENMANEIHKFLVGEYGDK